MEANFEKTAQRISKTRASELFYGIDKQSGAPVAIKLYQFTTDEPQRLMRELSVLKRLSHPNLIAFYNLFESADETALVTELAQEELVQVITERRYYCEDDCRGYVVQVLKGLQYLHDLNIGHLDLKPENVLIREQRVKLSDYDIGNLVPPALQLCSVGFFAPEQLCQESFDLEPDVYAIGVLTHLLLTGRLPFSAPGPDENETRHVIKQQLMFQFALKNSSIS